MTKTKYCVACKKGILIGRKSSNGVYCQSCYAKQHPYKTCVKCSKRKQIHCRDKLCFNCQRNTNCVRCNKEAKTFEIAKVTRYGAVCNICYVYFRDKQHCFECGSVSRNVSRSPLASHDKLLCLSCYYKYNFVVCQLCHRYRKVHNVTRQLCYKCDTDGMIACQKCKGEMPSGYGSRCRNCSKRELLFKKIRLNSYLFSHKKIKTAYRKFIFWYKRKVGIDIALRKSNNYVQFFMTCDNSWKSIPSYGVLVRIFKPEGLRKNLSVLRWLIETAQVMIDKSLKDEIAEIERIQALFNKFYEVPSCIQSYYQALQYKYEIGKTSLRSVRIALQPAIDLMVIYGVNALPTQKQLTSYLLVKTGQIAAITGFISHLKNQYNYDLNIDRPYLQKKKANRLKLEAKKHLVELYKKKSLNNKEQSELINITLYCLYGLQVKSPCYKNIRIYNELPYYYDENKSYFIPMDIFQKLKSNL